jgi:hypothetical protein
MAAVSTYRQIRIRLNAHLGTEVSESTRERIALLVTGIIGAKSAAPARIANAIKRLGLSGAQTDSIERRIRRIENDERLDATLCLHPFARQQLRLGKPSSLLLSIDPTTQEDRVVMVSVGVWYRARTLPLAWTVWPANQPLVGDGFWKRIERLLDVVAELLPPGIPVTWLADRAFGTPAFTDLVTERGWHYIVRVQGQTRCQDRKGVCRQVRHLVWLQRQRAKLRGWAFKKRGWREVSVVVYWGRRHDSPLCLVSDLPPKWYLILLYRRRFAIEATFRDYKYAGWQWERGQVTDLEHVKRLLVGMALAMWVVLCAGTQFASELLARPPTCRRRTVPWYGKRSLFTLGLQRLHELFAGGCIIPLQWQLTDWEAPNWQRQVYFYHARAFVFSAQRNVSSC